MNLWHNKDFYSVISTTVHNIVRKWWYFPQDEKRRNLYEYHTSNNIQNSICFFCTPPPSLVWFHLESYQVQDKFWNFAPSVSFRHQPIFPKKITALYQCTINHRHLHCQVQLHQPRITFCLCCGAFNCSSRTYLAEKHKMGHCNCLAIAEKAKMHICTEINSISMHKKSKYINITMLLHLNLLCSYSIFVTTVFSIVNPFERTTDHICQTKEFPSKG